MNEVAWNYTCYHAVPCQSVQITNLHDGSHRSALEECFILGPEYRGTFPLAWCSLKGWSVLGYCQCSSEPQVFAVYLISCLLLNMLSAIPSNALPFWGSNPKTTGFGAAEVLQAWKPRSSFWWSGWWSRYLEGEDIYILSAELPIFILICLFASYPHCLHSTLTLPCGLHLALVFFLPCLLPMHFLQPGHSACNC